MARYTKTQLHSSPAVEGPEAGPFPTEAWLPVRSAEGNAQAHRAIKQDGAWYLNGGELTRHQRLVVGLYPTPSQAINRARRLWKCRA